MTANKMYERTENGVTTLVTVEAARAEGDHAMTAGRRNVRSMSSSYGHHVIEYKDGRKVTLKMVDVPAEEKPVGLEQGPKVWTGEDTVVVTVKGKRYIAGQITRPGTEWAGINYWSERNGQAFGATRTACAGQKPGTVGRAIWDAVNA